MRNAGEDRATAAWRASCRPTLCAIACEVLCCSSAGITLIAGDHGSRLCVSDQTAATLEDLQFTTGEGPSVEGCMSDRPILVEDLGSAEAKARWPTFAAAARSAGIGAVTSFGLRVGGARIGVLTAYDDELTTASRWSGGDGPVQADGLVVADLVTWSILALQAGAPDDQLAAELAGAGSDRAEVHQASGIIAVQLGVGIAEALVRLRSHAYAVDRPIGDVAADVIAHRLRLDR